LRHIFFTDAATFMLFSLTCALTYFARNTMRARLKS
jgi:hypothetical protein